MAARIRSLRNGITPIDEASRDDLAAGDVVTVTSLDAATTYAWAIAFAPEGSTAAFSGSTSAVSPGTFIVDKEGPYLIRLVVDAALPTESSQWVRLRALTVFGQLSLVAAGERRDETGIIPVDVDVEGWANEQNFNLQTLKGFIKPFANSGRVFHADVNSGTTGYGDYDSVQDAIDAAVTAGAAVGSQWVILVHPGTFDEDLTLKPFVHLVGWPAEQNGRTTRIRGTHSTTLTGVNDVAEVRGLVLTRNGTSGSAVLTKTGSGTLRVLDSTVSSPGSGPAIQMSGGTLEVTRSSLLQTGVGATQRAIEIEGANSSTTLAYTTITGPNGVRVNNALDLGVTAFLSDCEITASNAAGSGLSGQANLVAVTRTVFLGTGTAVNYGNPAAPTGFQAVLDMSFSSVATSAATIVFDTTNLTTSVLRLGSVIYTTLSFPSGAPTVYAARTQAKTHFYDNTVSGLTAENVQDAIDEIAGGGGGEDLATTLGIGNTTGGSNIRLSTGDELRGVTDVVIRSVGASTDIQMHPGASGAVVVNGKLTVTGVIDPTALILSDPALGTQLYIESADGQTAPVSPAGTGRIRYNGASNQWEQSLNGAAYTSLGGGGASSGILTYHEDVPAAPGSTVQYRGWVPVSATLQAVRVYMQVPNTVGSYSVSVTNEATGMTCLVAGSFNMNTVAAATVTSLTLTAVPADLSFAALGKWTVAFTSGNPGFDGSGIYFELQFAHGSTGITGQDLATTLLLGNVTGGTDIILNSGDQVVGEGGLGLAGDAFIRGGTATGGVANGGDVILRPGEGAGGGTDGAVIVRRADGAASVRLTATAAQTLSIGTILPMVFDATTGKLTVPGVIDPTAVVFEEAGPPATTATEGAVFVSDGTAGLNAGALYFRGPSNAIPTELAPTGEDLAATLVFGNETGGTNIIVSSTDVIRGEDAVVASGNPGFPLILRGGSGDGAGKRGAVVLAMGVDGAIQVDTAGNTRGAHSVDFQAVRGLATEVASGEFATILNGSENGAYGKWSIVGGYRNVVLANATYGSIALGYQNSVTAIPADPGTSVAIGAFNDTSGPYAVAVGNSNSLTVPVGENSAFAFGRYNTVDALGGTALGSSHRIFSTAESAVAIGYRSDVYAPYAFGHGRFSNIYALAEDSIAMGAFQDIAARQSVAIGSYGQIFSTLGTSYAHTAMGIFNQIEPPTPMDGTITGTGRNWSTAAWRNYLLPRGEAYGSFVNGFDNGVMSTVSNTHGIGGLNTVDGSIVISSGRDQSGIGTPNISELGQGAHQASMAALGGATRGAVTDRLQVMFTASQGFFKLRQQMSYSFRILVVARQVEPHPTNGPVVVGTPGDSASWEFSGLCKRDEYKQATATLTVVAGTAGDTITVGTVVLTAVSGAPAALQYDISSGVPSTIASNIRTAINLASNGIDDVYTQTASAAVAVVTLVAYPVGTLGNAVVLSTSNPGNYTIVGFAGGTDTTVTLVGISAAGATAPTFNDAGAATWTAEVNVDATKQSLDVICTGQAGKYIKWEAMVMTSEAGRRPWNY